jgi:ketosteroid isomerase-like protein
VLRAVQALFEAFAARDMNAARALLAPDFHAFEHGVRFDADALVELIAKAQAGGTVFEWAITQPDIGIAGDMAWIAYANEGSVTRDGKRQPVTWMESAVLRREGERWSIRFLHSTRVVHGA